MPGKPVWLRAKARGPGFGECAPRLPKAWASVSSHPYPQTIHTIQGQQVMRTRSERGRFPPTSLPSTPPLIPIQRDVGRERSDKGALKTDRSWGGVDRRRDRGVQRRADLHGPTIG